jgi:hypothetical protein
MPLNPANGQFDLVEQFATADLYADLLGFFKPPSGTVQPSNVLWVAKAGGNYTSIQAAIDAAAAPASANNPYLVKIAPGVYTEQVTLKDFVDVEGSGANMTTIQWSNTSPTMTAGAQSEVRNLAIINTHNAAMPGANAVSQSGNTANGFTTLSNVAAVADGATDDLAVYVLGGVLIIEGGAANAALTVTPTGTSVALWASGATTSVIVRNSKLHAFAGATKQSAHQESGALIKIDNTELRSPTFGAPACFQTYDRLTFAAVGCP